jgi:hypothetical protein
VKVATEPHLHQHDAEHLVYDIAKPRPDGPRALVLTPLELINRVAGLVPPPRVHRHHSFGAGANGRSPEISGATADGWSWPL